MVLMDMTIFPNNVIGSMSPYVARVLDIVDKSGLKYRLSPMSTVIEGELEQVLAVATQCHNELAKDCDRISIAIRIDSKPGNNETRMESKVTAVEEKVGRKLVTSIG